ncbi:MAG: hypothetical protein ACRDGQ_14245 [Candidatus Limnocylindrales bacterium]
MTDEHPDPGTDLEQALTDYLAAQRMSRRQLLERIAAVGAAAALAPVIAALGVESAGHAQLLSPTTEQPSTPLPRATTIEPVIPDVPAVPLSAAPAQAAAGSNVIARILARIMTRG